MTYKLLNSLRAEAKRIHDEFTENKKFLFVFYDCGNMSCCIFPSIFRNCRLKISKQLYT